MPATLLALTFSTLAVIGIAEAGHEPLTSTEQAQFVAGCERSSGGAIVDCRCLLNRLEADGYTTPDSINALVQEARTEQGSGTTGTAERELTADALACRR